MPTTADPFPEEGQLLPGRLVWLDFLEFVQGNQRRDRPAVMRDQVAGSPISNPAQNLGSLGFEFAHSYRWHLSQLEL